MAYLLSLTLLSKSHRVPMDPLLITALLKARWDSSQGCMSFWIILIWGIVRAVFECETASYTKNLTDASPKSDLMCFELKRAGSFLTESSKAVTWVSRFIGSHGSCINFQWTVTSSPPHTYHHQCRCFFFASKSHLSLKWCSSRIPRCWRFYATVIHGWKQGSCHW